MSSELHNPVQFTFKTNCLLKFNIFCEAKGVPGNLHTKNKYINFILENRARTSTETTLTKLQLLEID